MHRIKTPSRILVCPHCQESLVETEGNLRCEQCNFLFNKNRYAFIEFTDLGITTITEEYALAQESGGERVYIEYLKPYLLQELFQRVLDVGCGIGQALTMLIQDGYDAYGIDLPDLSRYWAQAGNDPQHFFCCDATHLPFPKDFFDVTYSLGVVEHIGTRRGHCTLSNNYWEVRQEYADEILRVTKPGGRILIACPNKRFPVDIQHGPVDALTPNTLGNRLRNYIFERIGINIDPIWGKYHLLSYSETKRLFCGNGKTRSFEPLPLKGYFGFSRFRSGFLKPFATLATMYVDNLPRLLRSSLLNPYIIVEMRK